MPLDFFTFLRLSVKLSPPTCHLNASWPELWESSCTLYSCCGHTLTKLPGPQVANMILLMVKSYKPVVPVLMFMASVLWREFLIECWTMSVSVSPPFLLSLRLLQHFLPLHPTHLYTHAHTHTHTQTHTTPLPPSPRCEGSVGGARGVFVFLRVPASC